MQLPDELKQAIDNNAFCALSTKINEKEMQNHLMWVDYKDNKIAKKHLENLLLDMRQLYIEKYISNNTLGTNGKVIKEDKQE